MNQFIYISTRQVNRLYKGRCYSIYACTCLTCSTFHEKVHISQTIYWSRGGNNDMARNVVLHKSNKRTPAADILQLEFRQWQLCERERSKRKYTKKHDAYWETEIKEKRRKESEK